MTYSWVIALSEILLSSSSLNGVLMTYDSESFTHMGILVHLYNLTGGCSFVRNLLQLSAKRINAPPILVKFYYISSF